MRIVKERIKDITHDTSFHGIVTHHFIESSDTYHFIETAIKRDHFAEIIIRVIIS